MNWYTPCAYNEAQKRSFHLNGRKRLKRLPTRSALRPALRRAVQPRRRRRFRRSDPARRTSLCADLPTRDRLGQRHPHPHLRRTQGLHRRRQSLRAALMARRYPAIGASLPRRPRPRRPVMKLLTKEIRAKLIANGREQAKVKGTKAERDFRPSSSCSIRPDRQPGFSPNSIPKTRMWPGDLCDLGMGFPEFGTVRISELEGFIGTAGLASNATSSSKRRRRSPATSTPPMTPAASSKTSSLPPPASRRPRNRP